jgi:response regulator RpfG family c-di-GMP phosphodiesterase
MVDLGSGELPYVILVDDEPNVLNALKRALRSEGMLIDSSTDGREAIAKAKLREPAVIISDMRMPGLSGVEVLQAMSEVAPDCGRILLTGYADTKSTVDAINIGKVHRYLNKPWNDDELKLVIKDVLENRRLRLDRDRLARSLEIKNMELAELNRDLDLRVKARTSELEQTNLFLEQAQDELRDQYLNAVKTFANIIEMKSPAMAGHGRRVADLAKLMAMELRLLEGEVRDIYVAGLLHDIGKIGLKDEWLTMPATQLTGEDRARFTKHAVMGENALMGMVEMEGVSLLIRHHHERYDGQGFPDGLMKQIIPLGSRILTIAEDYDELQLGWLAPKTLTEKEAAEFIRGAAGKRYDPDLMLAFDAALRKLDELERPDEVILPVEKLQPGYVLTRNLLSRENVLLLAKGHMMNPALIRQLIEYQKKTKSQLKLYIRKDTVEGPQAVVN